MNKKHAPQKSVHDAISLSGDPDQVRDYYAQWAGTYNQDLHSEYRGAEFIAQLTDECVQQGMGGISTDRAALQVADIGCGTGLVGQAMAGLGYENIDGMDLSPEMVSEARALKCYRELTGDVDLNKALPAQWRNAYDVTLCCGVFTLGHVQPEALSELAAITRTGGLILISTRKAYFDTSDFQAVSDQLQADGIVRLLHSVMDAPYTGDSDAHYWVYQVCA